MIPFLVSYCIYTISGADELNVTMAVFPVNVRFMVLCLFHDGIAYQAIIQTNNPSWK